MKIFLTDHVRKYYFFFTFKYESSFVLLILIENKWEISKIYLKYFTGIY